MQDPYADAWDEWEASSEESLWRAVLPRLDGSRVSIVSEIGGPSRAELDEGGCAPDR